MASTSKIAMINSNNDDDDEDDLEALRTAALLSLKSNTTRCVETAARVGNDSHQPSFIQTQTCPQRFWNNRRRGASIQKTSHRSNLIVINPVEIKEEHPRKKLPPRLVLPQRKLCVSSNEDSTSPTEKRKGPSRFNRYESDSRSSDSEADVISDSSYSKDSYIQGLHFRSKELPLERDETDDSQQNSEDNSSADISQNESNVDISQNESNVDISQNDSNADLLQNENVVDLSQNDSITNLSQNDSIADLSQNDSIADLSQNDSIADLLQTESVHEPCRNESSDLTLDNDNQLRAENLYNPVLENKHHVSNVTNSDCLYTVNKSLNYPRESGQNITSCATAALTFDNEPEGLLKHNNSFGSNLKKLKLNISDNESISDCIQYSFESLPEEKDARVKKSPSQLSTLTSAANSFVLDTVLGAEQDDDELHQMSTKNEILDKSSSKSSQLSLNASSEIVSLTKSNVSNEPESSDKMSQLSLFASFSEIMSSTSSLRTVFDSSKDDNKIIEQEDTGNELFSQSTSEAYVVKENSQKSHIQQNIVKRDLTKNFCSNSSIGINICEEKPSCITKQSVLKSISSDHSFETSDSNDSGRDFSRSGKHKLENNLNTKTMHFSCKTPEKHKLTRDDLRFQLKKRMEEKNVEPQMENKKTLYVEPKTRSKANRWSSCIKIRNRSFSSSSSSSRGSNSSRSSSSRSSSPAVKSVSSVVKPISLSNKNKPFLEKFSRKNSICYSPKNDDHSSNSHHFRKGRKKHLNLEGRSTSSSVAALSYNEGNGLSVDDLSRKRIPVHMRLGIPARKRVIEITKNVHSSEPCSKDSKSDPETLRIVTKVDNFSEKEKIQESVPQKRRKHSRSHHSSKDVTKKKQKANR